MSKLRSKNAEFYAVELLISVTVLLIIIAAVYLTWQQIDLKEQQTNRIEMRLRADSISSALLNTQGIPSDWNSKDISSVYSIGLINDTNYKGYAYVDSGKMTKFQSLSYADLKTMLGTQGHDFSIQFKQKINNSFVMIGGVGINPVNATDVIVAERYCIIDGAPAQMVLKIW